MLISQEAFHSGVPWERGDQGSVIYLFPPVKFCLAYFKTRKNERQDLYTSLFIEELNLQ